jgi:hypothetical protein
MCILLFVNTLLHLQDLERKIVATCAGMPLVLELAGGRLRFKRDIEQWQVRALLHCGSNCHC